MHEPLTHASFFSGVGGTDLGLEAAGWRTISFSEIEPYANAVLAERWPGVPNIGDITDLAGRPWSPRLGEPAGGRPGAADHRPTEHGDSVGGRRGRQSAEPSGVGGGPAPLATDSDDRSQRSGRGRGRPHPRSDGESGGVPATEGGRAVPQQPVGQDLQGAGSGDSDGRDTPTTGVRDEDWRGATLWSGGFPCQDLSVAGKRAGFAGERSVLAFSFLDLVGRHRPAAVLIENVPGLLSSNGGRDFGRLIREMVELRYGVAYRVLDARFLGVPQRRRRVFILAFDLERGLTADRAAEVLSVGSRCDRHPPTGVKTGPRTSARPGHGISHALTTTHTRSGRLDPNGETFVAPPVRSGDHGDPGIGRDNDEDRLVVSGTGAGWWNEDDPSATGTLRAEPGGTPSHVVVSPEADPGGVRAADGLAGRPHDRDELAPTLRVGAAKPEDGGPGDTVPIVAATLNSGGNDGGFRTEPGEHLIYTKSRRAQTDQDDETWVEGEVMPTLNAFDVGDARTTAAIIQPIAFDPTAGRDMRAYDDGTSPGLKVGTTIPSMPWAPAIAFAQNQRDEIRELDEASSLSGPGTHQTTYLADAALALQARDSGLRRDGVDNLAVSAVSGDDDLLPLGLDSHRYRCCGNGVVAPVAEFIGERLAEVFREEGVNP